MFVRLVCMIFIGLSKTMLGFPWQLVICSMLVDLVVFGLLVVFVILSWKTPGGFRGSWI